MIHEPPPFKGQNTRTPVIIPIKGRGFINQGSGLNLEPCTPRPRKAHRKFSYHQVEVVVKYSRDPWVDLGLGFGA